MSAKPRHETEDRGGAQATGGRLGRLNRRLEGLAPPGPFRPGFWRSPLRGPWLTSVFGAVLLVGVPVLFVTGLLSYAAYNPRFAGNDMTPDRGLLGAYLFDWPTDPAWLYRLTQGIHVTVGIVLVPVLLAKLWSVINRFFEWPPVRSPAQLLERLSLALLVGGALFEFITGLMNIQLWYAWEFSFYPAHLYGAWVFMAAFAVHVAIKLPHMRTALRSRSLRRELRTPLSATRPEPADAHGLVAVRPDPPTLSRRGLLGLVAGSSLLLGVTTVGQSLGGFWRRLALLAPHGQSYGDGPNDFQVNKTAAYRRIMPDEVGPAWRLTVQGATTVELSREDLLAMTQHTHRLPIACVEGWSTTQTWTGVPLADLARRAGLTGPVQVRVESLQRTGAFRRVTLSRRQVADRRSLLALRVNGADLSLDHGFPARVIIPAAPGVHNTKWVARLQFLEA